MTYTFQSNKGFVKVEANTEDQARNLAMTKTYGPSTYGHEYRGLGLILISIE